MGGNPLDLLGGGQNQHEETPEEKAKKALDQEKRENQKRLDEMGLWSTRAETYNKSKGRRWAEGEWVKERSQEEEDRLKEEAEGGVARIAVDDDKKLEYGTYRHRTDGKLTEGLENHFIIYDKDGVHFSPAFPATKAGLIHNARHPSDKEYRDHMVTGFRAQCDFVRKLGSTSIDYDIGNPRVGSHGGKYYAQRMYAMLRAANEAGLTVNISEKTKQWMRENLSPKDYDRITRIEKEMHVNAKKDQLYLESKTGPDGSLSKYIDHLDDASKHPTTSTHPTTVAQLKDSETSLKELEDSLKNTRAILSKEAMGGTIAATKTLAENPERLHNPSRLMRKFTSDTKRKWYQKLPLVGTKKEDASNQIFFSPSEREEYKQRMKDKQLQFKEDPGESIRKIKEQYEAGSVERERALDKLDAVLANKDRICNERVTALTGIKNGPPPITDQKHIEEIDKQIAKVNELKQEVAKQQGEVQKLRRDHQKLLDPEFYKQCKKDAVERKEKREQEKRGPAVRT